MIEMDEVKAQECSKKFEQAQLVKFAPHRSTAKDIWEANDFLAEGRQGLFQDLRGESITEEFAELMYLGLYHYRGHIPPPPPAPLN